MFLELDKDGLRYFCVFRRIERGILVKASTLYHERPALGLFNKFYLRNLYR